MMYIIASSIITLHGQAKGDAIIGEWINEKKDAKFQIYRQDSKYYGKIIWGTGNQKLDNKNPDVNLRKREVIGLVILNDFNYKDNGTWEGGTIYDPREGKRYSCKITLKDKDKISVRGYVGISLFGRSEIWTKVK